MLNGDDKELHFPSICFHFFFAYCVTASCDFRFPKDEMRKEAKIITRADRRGDSWESRWANWESYDWVAKEIGDKCDRINFFLQ